MGKLDGKVVVITGTGSGLGKQFAIRMAEEGAKLAICTKMRKDSRLQNSYVKKRALKLWHMPVTWLSMTNW